MNFGANIKVTTVLLLFTELILFRPLVGLVERP